MLKKLSCPCTVVLATYGKMSCGNVLWQCQKRCRLKMVGGAYVPTSHCYIPGDPSFDRWETLDFVGLCLVENR